MKQKLIRFTVPLLAFLLLSRPLFAADAPALQENDYVAVIGDSITEQTRYSVFIEDYLLMCKPAPNLQVTQFGWGGETAVGFAGRMQNDLIPFNCTVATTCYGMNDGGYGPITDAIAKRYTDNEKTIIDRLKAGHVRFIVLGSPGCVDSTTYHDGPAKAEIYNKTLASLRDLNKKLAEEQGVGFADVFTPMLDVMAKAKEKYGAKYDFCGMDGVHPNFNGHLVMAYAFLKALGCNGDIGTITADMGANTAQATEGHKIISDKDGVVTVESTKYPFCFTGDPASSSATTGVIEFLPFNDDLNRFKLVVNNATSDRVKITWGKSSKEFAAADLKKGINLAAEFLDNPFSGPFADVQQKISQQQRKEVNLVKNLIHNLPGYETEVPDKKDQIENFRGDLLKSDQVARDASAAAVAPVTHTITIEAVK